MRRIPSCIGFDPDIKEYLDSREQRTNAEFINCLIRAYKEQEAVREVVGKIERSNPVSMELMGGVSETLGDTKSSCEEKIRKVITEKPYKWIIPIKTGKMKVTRKLIVIIEDDTKWLDCDAKPTERSIRRILKEEVDKFDMTSVKVNDGNRG